MQNATNHTCTVEISHTYQYPQEIIWQAWVDPEIAAQFLFKTDHGTMKQVKIDAKLNGTFTIIEERNGTNAAHQGRYVEWNFPNQMRFVFGPNLENTTSVTLYFEKVGHTCLLRLRHEGVWLDFEERVRASWITALEKLQSALDSGRYES